VTRNANPIYSAFKNIGIDYVLQVFYAEKTQFSFYSWFVFRVAYFDSCCG